MKTNVKKTMNAKVAVIGLIMVISSLYSCTNNDQELQAKIDSLEQELQAFKDEKAITKRRLEKFDSLDFLFYTGQKWDEFAISHSDDIKVVYPDGLVTEGLFPEHINMLTPMFVFAPDTKIEQHPVKFGSGEWTAAIGVLEGTFTEPMPIGDDNTIPPTGKKFKINMATIGHWGPDGKMTEEYLFWDNQAFMKQIGLAQ